MLKVAADNKGVKFEHATGYKTAENMRTYDSRTYEGAYMAGVIAGKMTKSNTLGVVGSIPIPEVIRNINSFTMGAQSVNPKIKTKVVWVNEWFNPPKGNRSRHRTDQRRRRRADAEHRLLGRVADRRENGQARLRLGFRHDRLWPQGPPGFGRHQLGPLLHQGRGRRAGNGKWATGQAWWGVKEGAIDMVSVAADVPDDTKKRIDEIKAGLKDGSFSIWKGPIMDNTGKELLAAGTTADDKFLGGLKTYVKGVEGKVPGGN